MPDWSYHLLFKPILSHLPTSFSREFIHRGMNTIASFPGGNHFINFLGREESSLLLEKEIQGMKFHNPVGLSGKIDPLLSGTKAFSNLGFGFIEIGPVTTNAQLNDTAPAVNHRMQIIEFSSNYESIGLHQTIQKLSKQKIKQPLIIRLAGTIAEQLEMIAELDPFADAFIIESTHTSFIGKTNKPLFLAIATDDVSQLSLDSVKNYFSGIVLDEPIQVTPKENLSKLLEEIKFLRENHSQLPIITSGGIYEPADALKLLDAGANLVMLSGGYVFSGPGLTKRINEAILSELQPKYTSYKGWEWYWLFGCSIFIGGIIALIISLTTIILPYDEHFLGMNRELILLFNERILLFMAHDRMTLAGTMISGGVVYMALAKYGVRNGLLWAKQAIDLAAILGFFGIFLFIGYGYFDWLHLIFWLVLLPMFVIGFLKTKHLRGTPSSLNRRNHQTWKRSLVGQLAFVILGFSFVLGGIIISLIGVSNVFVSTDILYLCMPPEMLDSFNDKLISVIAHDRAGFGSALLSVGFLVLMLSLWGFQQGNRWVWWTLLFGGFPAFIAGIWIHFAIGYTTFIHLLPAYFALFLYVIGLLMSYPFFHKKEDEHYII
ncbi:dihydroorotate dehydrogenase [Fredinandcohnia quinoae]|uniref:Dihydroorotate dehydrogenase n=1 Tax=Fredinandcohnia quinoae TaxID=2918902 RepID=A0AAW5E259_9BACI|nr:dihydroorotate dehydrogenase [Fredinandcohnia sp. SECRCQ15]MCH1624844.1 dihydroorotate dehydrogenase [Fredinandcohnia sp. SECRCQ15]